MENTGNYTLLLEKHKDLSNPDDFKKFSAVLRMLVNAYEDQYGELPLVSTSEFADLFRVPVN